MARHVRGRVCKHSSVLSRIWLGLLIAFAWQIVHAGKILTGEIEGAKYEIRLPSNIHQGRLLLLAHGYRPESLPLKASVGSSHGLHQKLVDKGWAVASTSYRRNGWIMEDAAEDLILLHDFILENTEFRPEKVYLMGNSMGGGIVTWLSEHAPERFDGGLAMGAYLFEPLEKKGDRSTTLAPYLKGEPGFPILFLTNISELDGPSNYVSLAETSEIPPALWVVRREGHVNQNEAEQAAGLAALVTWVEEGEIDRFADATIELIPTSTAEVSDGCIVGKAKTLVPVYGNIICSFVRTDLATLGIETGDSFKLTAAGKTVTVKLGTTYTDVPVGEWVGFWDAEGYLLICRNYKDAVSTLGIEENAVVKIGRCPPNREK